ncbi:unnamed protein product [Prorocentrum cordatum]|uniref:Uncharacterized protein n=1 Tax=Prorocentrum cordatum TaxID=2364126 RepID=A0ABN9SAY8_9DINO|nr:unnamed protein product [Polarella glacialis]
MQVMKYCLASVLAPLNYDSEEKGLVASCIGSHGKYRSVFGYDHEQLSKVWLHKHAKPLQELIKMFADSGELVHGIDYDGPIKNAVRFNSSMEELFDRTEIKEVLTRLIEQSHSHLGTVPESARRAPVEVTDDAENHSIALGFAMKKGGPGSLSDRLGEQTASMRDVLEKKWKIFEKLACLSEDAKHTLETIETAARQKVSDHVAIIVEGSTSQAMGNLISNTFVGGLRGDDHKKVLIIYDNKQAGESMTAPHIRMPSFKSDRLKKMMILPVAVPPD